MNTTDVMIAALVITLISLILKFIKTSRENAAIFRDIKEKRDKIIQEVARQQKNENVKKYLLGRFRLAISDWFSAVAIMILSYLLLYEYLNIEPITKANVFRVGLMITLLLFNIVFLAVSIIERRLGYWIDEFTTINEHIFANMPLNKGKSVSPKKKSRR